MHIASVNNPKIKRVVRLKKHRYRQEQGVTIVEGRREIKRAIDAGVLFQECYYAGPDFQTQEAQGFLKEVAKNCQSMYSTRDDVFSKMAYGARRDGVLAVCIVKPQSMDSIQSSSQGLYVIIEAVEKPGNLGAILRTCDGAGVDAVFVCHEKTDVYNPNCIRASLGTIFNLNVVVESSVCIQHFLKENHICVYAATPEAKCSYTEVNLGAAAALVVGSEHLGLSDFWRQTANECLSIPMCGRGDSLNVSNAAAILLYEAVRQRGLG